MSENRMDLETYHKKLDAILEPLPKAFRSFVSSLAYNKGHAYGYEEVLSHAETLASGIEECISQWDREKRMEE